MSKLTTGATDEQLSLALQRGMQPDCEGWTPFPLALKRDIAKIAQLLVPPGQIIIYKEQVPTERELLAIKRVLRFGMDKVHTLQMLECEIVHAYLERQK